MEITTFVCFVPGKCFLKSKLLVCNFSSLKNGRLQLRFRNVCKWIVVQESIVNKLSVLDGFNLNIIIYVPI